MFLSESLSLALVNCDYIFFLESSFSFWIKQGPRDIILAACTEAAMGRQRKEKRLKKKLLRELREKAKEIGMLKRKKQSMVAEQAAKEKMVADFMVYIEAIEKNDTGMAQKFDGKAMKNTILSMMEGGWRQNEGFASDHNVKSGNELSEVDSFPVLVFDGGGGLFLSSQCLSMGRLAAPFASVV
ncbi:hypothetical protein V6N12_004090 [Hibiscus sabdariffa]|uniref:Uncharacterized protein n=1 Tax=Hibiscus sabdariffa TaxID=183260 RepID=A0ABR2CMN7_9ROSI